MSSPASKNKRFQRSQRGLSRPLGLVLLAVWLAALVVVAANRQNIFDWWRLRGYQAPSNIAQLATQDTMTPYARKVFYVNKPALDDKAPFNTACPNNGGEQTIVLGCYHSNQAGIFLLNVSDPRLDGVEQVTAAHEMLHAAYDRLSSSERTKVDAMLMDYYNNDLHDPRIQSTIAAYKKSEPHDVVNEMHSVFGTEVASLPAPLEAYYTRYFTNRPQIAAYAAQYQSEFTTRQTQVTQDDSQLTSLKQQIDAGEADLKAKQTTITSTETSLLAQKNAGQIAAYNAGVPGYNQLVDAYNQQAQTVRNVIVQYNQLVAARNAIALEEDQLSNELTASPQPIQ